MYLVEALNEWSKAEAIPELNRVKDHLAVFVFGAPGAGKTTFVRSFFGAPRGSVASDTNNYTSSITTPAGINYRLFNTDMVSKLFTNDLAVYKKGTTSLVLSMIEVFTRGGGNFIFDSTGNTIPIVKLLMDECRTRGYKVIFIHLMADKNVLMNRNATRTKPVEPEYLKHSISKSEEVADKLDKLDPDKYYVVYNNLNADRK